MSWSFVNGGFSSRRGVRLFWKTDCRADLPASGSRGSSNTSSFPSPHWQTRTAAERDEFVHLFADLLERTYISKIDLFGGEKLKYTAENVDGEYAVVRAKVITKKGTEIPVEARMLQREGHWLIYDISVANVSLIANYRTQFDRIIRTSSYQELVRKLRDNRDQFLNEKPGRTS